MYAFIVRVVGCVCACYFLPSQRLMLLEMVVGQDSTKLMVTREDGH
jgi:hypothetical protein